MILRFIRKFLGLCDHTWEDKQVVNNHWAGAKIGQSMCQRCYHCGKFRNVKMF